MLDHGRCFRERLQELDQVAGAVAHEGGRVAFHNGLEGDVRAQRPQPRCHGSQHVRHFETHVLVAVGLQVAVGHAAVFGQRGRAFDLEDLDAEIAPLHERQVGRDGRDEQALLELEAQHRGVPVQGGVQVGHADAEVVCAQCADGAVPAHAAIACGVRARVKQ